MRRTFALGSSVLVVTGALFPSACSDTTTTIGKFSPRSDSSTGGAGGDASLGGSAADLGIFFEAEDGLLSGPFAVETTASPATVYITASEAQGEEGRPGSARALYQFAVEQAGNYLIWGRILSPGALENRFWFRVNGGAWTLWRISTGEEWFWDDFHNDTNFGEPILFHFDSGPQELELANSVTGSKLDAIAILPSGTSPPMQRVVCNPPHSVLLEGKCVPSCGSYLNVSCIPSACENRETVVAYDCAVCCLLE
jgi:hypothetical protein